MRDLIINPFANIYINQQFIISVVYFESIAPGNHNKDFDMDV